MATATITTVSLRHLQQILMQVTRELHIRLQTCLQFTDSLSRLMEQILMVLHMHSHSGLTSRVSIQRHQTTSQKRMCLLLRRIRTKRHGSYRTKKMYRLDVCTRLSTDQMPATWTVTKSLTGFREHGTVILANLTG